MPSARPDFGAQSRRKEDSRWVVDNAGVAQSDRGDVGHAARGSLVSAAIQASRRAAPGRSGELQTRDPPPSEPRISGRASDATTKNAQNWLKGPSASRDLVRRQEDLRKSSLVCG